MKKAAKKSTYPSEQTVFGCDNKPNSMLKNLPANGILGLSPKTNTPTKTPNFLDSLHEYKHVRSKNFSLCVGSNGGYMTIGGVNKYKQVPKEKSQVVPFDPKSSDYQIEIIDILFKPKTKEEIQQQKKENQGKKEVKPPTATFDTVNKMSEFAPKLFNKIVAQFDTFCANSKEKSKCAGNKKFGEQYCAIYDPKTHGNLEEFYDSHPKIFFKLKNDSLYIWLPQNYLVKNDSDQYCAQISKSEKNATKLGSSFMADYNMYFNRNKHEIKFIRAACDGKKSVKGINQLVQNFKGKKRNLGAISSVN